MRRTFPALGRLLGFWLVFFLLQRALFLAYAWRELHGAALPDLLLSQAYGLRYDVSAACALLLPSLLLLALAAARPAFKPGRWLRRLNELLVVLASLGNAADMEVHRNWGARVNERALSYLVYPKEIAASVSWGYWMLLALLIAVQVLVGWHLLRRWEPEPASGKRPWWALAAAAALLALGLRGGPAKLPLGKGWGYFSKHPTTNHAAINGLWNLAYELAHPSSGANPYKTVNDAEARDLLAALRARKSGATPKILSQPRPNIVLIMLESWGADVIAPLGGEEGVTPFFNALSREGLLFTNFYASGFRTEQGLVAIFGGFPSQPKATITRDFGKFDKLPSILAPLEEAGYAPTVYYGSELSFANTGAYLRSAGFKTLYGQGDFPFTGTTTWGVYDEDLFNFNVSDLKNLKAPFFSLILTITSHERFDAPGPVRYPGSDLAPKYRNAVRYTDDCLKDYFEKARREPWFKDTLFVLVADHAHIYPLVRSYYEPGRFHIPMLLYGEPLKKDWRGKTVAKFATQTDIPALLLSQLGLKTELPWSKDPLDPAAPSFAYYAFDEGFGWLSERESYVFDYGAGKAMVDERGGTGPLDGPRLGKAYLQTNYQQYLDY